VHAPVLEGAGGQMAGVADGGRLGDEPAFLHRQLAGVGAHYQQRGVVVDLARNGGDGGLGELFDVLLGDLVDASVQVVQRPPDVDGAADGAPVHQAVGVQQQRGAGGKLQIGLVVDRVVVGGAAQL